MEHQLFLEMHVFALQVDPLFTIRVRLALLKVCIADVAVVLHFMEHLLYLIQDKEEQVNMYLDAKLVFVWLERVAPEKLEEVKVILVAQQIHM
jgi:hypothetical protein